MARLAPVFLLALSLLLTTSRAAKDAVLDTDGNPLQIGVQYRVLPASHARGGGLYMSRENGACPPQIVQHQLETNKGQPVMFFSEEERTSTDRTVRISTQLYVLTPRPSSCSDSTMWRVNDKLIVTTGGITSGGADPHFSRFSISKADDGEGYQIQSSPCRRCDDVPRSNLAVKNVNGRLHLSVRRNDNSYKVVFERAAKGSSADDILISAAMRAEE